MRVRLRHETRYAYPKPASLGPHVVRLRPADHSRSKVLTYDLSISPRCEIKWQRDPANNHIARATWPAGRTTNELAIVVDATIDVRPINPFDFFVDDSAKDYPFQYSPELATELAPYLVKPVMGPRTSDFAGSLPKEGGITTWVTDVNALVSKEINYVLRSEIGIQTSEQTLEIARGSCRDSARLLVDVFRARGIAARFVSGYLIQLMDEGDIPGERKGVAMDVVDLHAWAEVYIPGAGWIGLDGTSGLLCGEGHIPLACTADPFAAAPVDGTSSETAELSFLMQVERIGHEPTPRRPYTDDQWEAMKRAGAKVDATLARKGMLLTMGGEPTWVSREHAREPEWNSNALGPTKWTHGLRFVKEIAQRIAKGVLVIQRQGKHYPGESLPRWVLQTLWRKDGKPIWHDPTRLAWEGEKERTGGTQGPAEADRFMKALARRLGVPPEPMPAFEDPWLHIMQEENLPFDVDPLKADLKDSEQRKTLSRVLNRGLDTPVGYALPIGRDGYRWYSDKWTFRRTNLFLVPGDSPMGLRLPLDRIGGAAPVGFEQDPSLIDRRVELKHQERGLDQYDPQAVPWNGGGAGGGILRTALCTEVRDGVLHVFIPPMWTTLDFLDLVATIEDTAVETGLRVRIEGYPPPSDPRIGTCLVTPDPGVIEVNIPPTDNFEEYVGLMEMLSESSRHSGLWTMKLQLDGREAGTGGGHHLAFGGPSALESPFLRRPDMLGSVLRYVQNHPSLSYLFTGLFVGPTSQAPRIDEARHDALYELEIALSRIPRFGSSESTPPPWLIDRLLRNLAVDVEGNTHRTEICLDKLYDPRSVAGRQGLIELRAFEMPPHERMAISQMLLMRGLMAMFASQPYERPLIRWGSELHDRFMLPHYLWKDFEDILGDLSQVGIQFERDWFRPFVDLRCPLLGSMNIEDVSLEVRAAIEPWPVLGEEQNTVGTVRHVDSSLERVEVRLDGITEGRHVLLVNGMTLPMRKTGRAAERVAGIRFRAWQPTFCLQPTIGIHHPLRFDLLDTWARRSLGAATYYVTHPAGRSWDEPPLTIQEASARRAARFSTLGHAHYPVIPIDTRVTPEQPYTIDLRRYPFDRRPDPAV